MGVERAVIELAQVENLAASWLLPRVRLAEECVVDRAPDASLPLGTVPSRLRSLLGLFYFISFITITFPQLYSLASLAYQGSLTFI